MWNLPRPAAIEPVSPALAGRFLSTAPPGKSPTLVNFDRPINYVSLKFFKFRLGITSFEKLFVVIPNLEFFCSWFSSVQLLRRVWLWWPQDCSTPGFSVHHQLLELVHIHVHQVGDAIQPSHPLSSPSPPEFFLVFFSIFPYTLTSVHFLIPCCSHLFGSPLDWASREQEPFFSVFLSPGTI